MQNRSSAETRLAFARLVLAGALVEASPIIQQKGDTFRALLIILSKQSRQIWRATVRRGRCVNNSLFQGWNSTAQKRSCLLHPITMSIDMCLRTVLCNNTVRVRCSLKSARVAGVRILDGFFLGLRKMYGPKRSTIISNVR